MDIVWNKGITIFGDQYIFKNQRLVILLFKPINPEDTPDHNMPQYILSILHLYEVSLSVKIPAGVKFENKYKTILMLSSTIKMLFKSIVLVIYQAVSEEIHTDTEPILMK